ncbi:hypothetical protein ACE6H2_013935 [Prunus campanulata]
MSSHPPNDSASAFSLRHPSVPLHHSTRAMSSHPPNDSASTFCLRPSAPLHHSARAMSSHPPNDSASAFGIRHPCIIRRVRCLHIPPMIRHLSSAFGTLASFGACDVFTSLQ